jgi:heterodisulfide reductase subunit B
MKVGYFPGCSLHATAREFAESLDAVARAIELDLEEVADWSCCGATSAHATNHLLSIALAGRNLGLANKQKLDRVMAPCAACYSRLAVARHTLHKDAKIAARVQAMMGPEVIGDVEVLNIVDLLQPLIPKIREKVERSLTELKVVCYYGCLLVRPGEVTGCVEPDSPTGMEEIVRAVGATPLQWNSGLNCCGGGFSIPRTGSVLRLGRGILADARSAGAQAIVVACPMCQSNLDLRQSAMLRSGEQTAPVPILYLTQLLGLAFAIDETRLGLQRHFVSLTPLVGSLHVKALPAAMENA